MYVKTINDERFHEFNRASGGYVGKFGGRERTVTIAAFIKESI